MIADDRCDLISRKNNRYKSFGPLREALAVLHVRNAVLDGEICCLDDDGPEPGLSVALPQGTSIRFALRRQGFDGMTVSVPSGVTA